MKKIILLATTVLTSAPLANAQAATVWDLPLAGSPQAHAAPSMTDRLWSDQCNRFPNCTVGIELQQIYNMFGLSPPGPIGNCLLSNGSIWVSGSGCGGAAAGSNAQVQFNSGGLVSAAPGLTFDPFTGLHIGVALGLTSGGTGAPDAPTARVNLGAAASGPNSDITSLSALGWTTANRPAAPALGMFSFNTTLGAFETWNGSSWVQFRTGALSVDNFYVSNTTGSDTNNNCSDSNNKCASINAALLQSSILPATPSTQTVINIGDGVHAETYYESASISGLRSGFISVVQGTQAEIIFSGSGSALTTIAGNGISVSDFIANKNATVGVQKMTLTATARAGQEELYAQLGGTFYVLGNDVVFGPSTSGHQIFCENPGPSIEVWGNYTITGGADRHIGVAQGCYVHFNLPTVVTIQNTPTYTTAFIVANTAAGVQFNYGVRLVGPVNAVPFIIQGNAWIENSAYNGSSNTNYTWPASILTAASWSANQNGLVTYTTTNTAHNIPVGGTFTILGNTPSGYDGTFIAVAGTAGNTIVAAMAANPGPNTVLGSLVAGASGFIPGNVAGIVGSGGRLHTDYAACIGGAVGCANANPPTGLGTGGTAGVSGSTRSGAVTLRTGSASTSTSGYVFVYMGESLQRVGGGYGPCTVSTTTGASPWASTARAYVSGQNPATPPYVAFGWATNGAALTLNSTYILNYVCDGDF